MSELRRLLDGDSDELALEILRSAGEDSPSADSLKAAALALGVSGALGGSALLASGLHAAGTSSAAASGVHAAVSGAPAGAATVASITVGAVLKQVAIGVAAGVFAMGGVQLVSEQLSPSAPPAAKATVSSLPASAMQARSHNSSPVRVSEPAPPAGRVVEAPAALSPNSVPAPPAARRPSATSEASTASKAVKEAPASGGLAAPAQAEPVQAPQVAEPPVALNKSLAAEVALLDRARNALLAQNPSAALRALEQYRKERQTAILEPEANVLQIQALDKLGEHAAAVRLARTFVRTHPDSRHVDSLRALAAEAP